MVAVAQRAVEQYRASWVLNRILSDRGRLVSALMALYLHYAVPDRSGFTLVQFRAEAARQGFASPGRVTAWAATMRLMGYLAPCAAGRPQRLVPTAKFFAVIRERVRRNWQSIVLVYPPVQQAITTLEDDRFLEHLANSFMGAYRNGVRVFSALPELAGIADREAGICILFSILLRDAAGEPIVVAGLAREFFVSRAHVRSILQAIEAMGMLTRSPGDGAWKLQPRFEHWLARIVASLFQTHIFTVGRALALLAADPPARGATVVPDMPAILPPPEGQAIHKRLTP